MSHTSIQLPTHAVDTDAGKPGPFQPVLVTQGPTHTVTVAYWHPDFDNQSKPKWVMNGYAGHIIPECFHPNCYTELPEFGLGDVRMKLTHEWQPYNGEYEKAMQDVQLRDGTVVKGCWPNHGHWTVAARKAENAPQYFNKSIPNSEVAAVRLTHLNE